MRLADALGYARVSTAGQGLEVQRRRLRDEAKAVRVFEDVISGKGFERPGLTALLDYARPGDVVCVVRLDRLGRSLLLLLGRSHFKWGVSLLAGNGQKGGEQRRDVLGVQLRTSNHRLQLVEPRGRRLAGHKTSRMPDVARDWVEGVVDVVRRALIAHPHMRLVADPLA